VSLPEDQVQELLRIYPEAKRATEAGVTYFLLPQLALPAGCLPVYVDALLCPTPRDGYESRLFFAHKIQGCPERNWNGTARILDINWQSLSWRTRPGLRLVQMVSVHLDALRN